ncbi:mitochondrial inner membrane protein OXA1L [Cinclus cinclus]|uniref:mitochondrial inner membrane protein OXA1L n=1 Tax=Cinclus cinclus TaxID=127875 RepID=UPI002E1033F1
MIQNLLEFLHLELGMPWWAAIAAGEARSGRGSFWYLWFYGVNSRPLDSPDTSLTSRNSPGVSTTPDRGIRPQPGGRGLLGTGVVPAAPQRESAPGFPGAPRAGNGFDSGAGFSSGWVGLVPEFGGSGSVFCSSSSGHRFHLARARVGGGDWRVRTGGGPVRQILRFLPLVFLPFIIHFPTAVFTYWLTSNSFSLLQTGLLRVPALRAKLGMVPPPSPQATPTGPALPAKTGIFKQLKKEWREAQATHEAERRQWRLKNHLNLAAKGPLRQTFSQNPLSPPGSKAAVPSETPKRPWKNTLG